MSLIQHYGPESSYVKPRSKELFLRLIAKRIIIQRSYITSCWEYSGYKDKDGYGRLFIGNRFVGAHRLILELILKDFNSKLMSLHKCNNPACFRPSHLYQGTHKNNMSDMILDSRHKEQKKTHCKRGHEFTPENTYISPKSKARVCRTCMRIKG